MRCGSRRGDNGVDAGRSGEHVFRQAQDDRAWPAAGRRAKRARHVFGDAVRVVDLRRPLGERAEHRVDRDLLERFAIAKTGFDLSDEEDHGRGILLCGVNRDRRVRRARTAGDEADSRAARYLAVRLRHVRRAAFLAAHDRTQGIAHVVERVERFQIAFTGNQESMICTVPHECVDQHGSTGPGVHNSPLS